MSFHSNTPIGRDMLSYHYQGILWNRINGLLTYTQHKDIPYMKMYAYVYRKDRADAKSALQKCSDGGEN